MINTNIKENFPVESTHNHFLQGLEAVAQRCSVKNGFLKISQNSQENTCTRA